MIQALLELVNKTKSSDLHICSGSKPYLRIDGSLKIISEMPVLDCKTTSDIIESLMSEHQKLAYKTNLEIDFSISSQNGDRFRVNAFNTLTGPAAAFRIIPAQLMNLSEIRAPKAIYDLCNLKSGLILVTGPTGNGKSTTMAAMIQHINQNCDRHIVTIEDPIEFVYKNDKSLINQREVGNHTISFPNALKSVLREDPDVIMVGEMRDLETIKLVVNAAETGHLVLATLHTNSASQSINRMVNVFSEKDKEIIRSSLSSSIQGVISQRLIKKNGGGRCTVFEIMLANSSIRNLIRENKIPQIDSMIEINKKQGMITSKDSITDLLNQNIISREIAEEAILLHDF